jgi:tetratricopeptide (TPR) repeat protein
MGRSDEAIRELRIAESLDPLALDVQSNMGLALYLARRYAEAEQVLQSILRQDPNMVVAHRHLVRLYGVRDQIPAFLAEIVQAHDWYSKRRREWRRWPSSFAASIEPAVRRHSGARTSKVNCGTPAWVA